jgi:hypothetical protein
MAMGTVVASLLTHGLMRPVSNRTEKSFATHSQDAIRLEHLRRSSILPVEPGVVVSPTIFAVEGVEAVAQLDRAEAAAAAGGTIAETADATVRPTTGTDRISGTNAAASATETGATVNDRISEVAGNRHKEGAGLLSAEIFEMPLSASMRSVPDEGPEMARYQRVLLHRTHPLVPRPSEAAADFPGAVEEEVAVVGAIGIGVVGEEVGTSMMTGIATSANEVAPKKGDGDVTRMIGIAGMSDMQIRPETFAMNVI